MADSSVSGKPPRRTFEGIVDDIIVPLIALIFIAICLGFILFSIIWILFYDMSGEYMAIGSFVLLTSFNIDR